MFGSKSTRFLTTPNTPESGRTSPTASRIEGAFVVNHASTFVSRSRRLFFEGVNGAKVYSAQHEDVDAVKVVPCRGSPPRESNPSNLRKTPRNTPRGVVYKYGNPTRTRVSREVHWPPTGYKQEFPASPKERGFCFQTP